MMKNNMNLADIKRVGVIGGGTMGFGIAINFALWGYSTVIRDLSDEIREQSMKRVKSAMALLVEEELITQKQASEPFDEATEKIRARLAEGKPWFVDSEKFDEAIEKRDREYIRRLKELYWSEEW